MVQNSIHSSSWIVPSSFLSTWSKSSFVFNFAKLLDQNLRVSCLSIVLDPSLSIKLNSWMTFSLTAGGRDCILGNSFYNFNFYFTFPLAALLPIYKIYLKIKIKIICYLNLINNLFFESYHKNIITTFCYY